MRRRRQKNTLLPKMLGLAVLINAILLPILAQFGVFKSIGGRQTLTPVELVKVPPAEKRLPPKKTPKKQAAKPHPAGRKAAAHMAAARHVPSGPPPVRVVAAGPTPGGAGSGGDAGITGSSGGPTPPAGPPITPPVTAPPQNTLPAATPPPTPVSPPPVVPAPPPAAHVPTLTAAVPLSQPRPEIPEELRDTELNATFEGVFTVHADGTATVKAVSGTGNAILDAAALNAARRWTFRPATKDGQPVESYLRLKIEFDVGA